MIEQEKSNGLFSFKIAKGKEFYNRNGLKSVMNWISGLF